MIGEKRWKQSNPGYKAEWEIFVVPEQFQHRCYTFFSHLAGVRGYPENEPISDHRGLPKDIGEQARKWFDCDPSYKELSRIIGFPGDHSPGYATLEELRSHDWWCGEEEYYSLPHDLVDFLERESEYHDCRILFNFDS